MTTTLFRARIKDEHVDDFAATVQKMFDAINAAAPEGVKYGSARSADGTFVAVLSLDGEQNPLVAVPEFAEFQTVLPGWFAEPPVVEQLDVLGSYRLF